jgi:SAM-dependent methyltransferase
MSKYIHEKEIHNLDAPNEIVPVVYQLLKPKSVIDIGCGLGNFLKVFKTLGVTDVLGVDGKWVDREKLQDYIMSNEFLEHDLETKLSLNKKFDLVLCLEVAEHLSEASADIVVENLINAGEVILFSAAIPFQGGQNHVNEQWLTYWESKFLKHNYVIHDVMRPIFWDNEKVNWWYKQDMVIIAPKEFVLDSNVELSSFRNIVHSDMYLRKCKQLDSKNSRLNIINSGRAGKRFYLKVLLRSFLKK